MGETRKSVRFIKRLTNMRKVISGDSYDILKDFLVIYKPIKLSRRMREYYANLMLERLNYVRNQNNTRE
jgi:hypothetical protein